VVTPGHLYEVKVPLKAGLNTIGWCSHADINVDRHYTTNIPTLAFPGRQGYTMHTSINTVGRESELGAAGCRADNEPLIYSLDECVSAPYLTVFTKGRQEKEGVTLTDGWLEGARKAQESGEGGEGGLPGKAWCTEAFLLQQEGKEREKYMQKHMHTHSCKPKLEEMHPTPTLALSSFATCISNNAGGGRAMGNALSNRYELPKYMNAVTRHYLMALPHTWVTTTD
jgi:hypothetical protein